MSRPKGAWLPRSGVGVAGPWLVIEPPGAASIRIDLRQLDDVTLLEDDDSDNDEEFDDIEVSAARKAKALERRKSILLVLDELEIAMYIADGRAAARQLVREAKEWLDAEKQSVDELTSAETPPSSANSRDAKLVVLSSVHPDDADDADGKDDVLARTVFDLVWPQATIGRTAENSIMIDHGSVSRTHARLTRDSETGHYTIHEVSSTNGIRVNGKDVSVVELAHLDIVDLGHVRMRFIEVDAGRWPVGPPVPERFVLVDGAPVLVDGEFLRIGDLRFRLSEVHQYALRGANLPLRRGTCIQAAVTMLVAMAAGWEGPEEERFGIKFDPDEPRVEDVEPDSAGAIAGVRAGDEVIAIGAGSGILHPGLGDHVLLRIARNGQQIQVALRAEHAEDLPDELNCKAPVFSATTVRGDQVSLGELAGHVVVLDFWSSEDELSRGKLKHLATLHARYSDLRIVGISRDEPIRSEAVSLPEYTLIHDRNSSINKAYDASAPMLVVIDREGIVRKIESGVPDFERLEAELVTLMDRAVP